MSDSSLQNDIDYMKSLAIAGGTGPLRNGAMLFWAGLIFGIATIGQYSIIKGWLPQTTLMNLVVWLGAGVIFGVTAFIVLARGCRVPVSAAARAANSAWSAVGLGIGAFVITFLIIASLIRGVDGLYFVISPVVLIMYGMGWWVSARMSGAVWLKWVAFGAFAAAPVMGLMAGRPEQLLVYAACLLLFAILPGLVLMRAEKA